MGLKLSKRRRGRSYSFSEKDRPLDSNITGVAGDVNTGKPKKSKRSVSSAAKFSSTRDAATVLKVSDFKNFE